MAGHLMDCLDKANYAIESVQKDDQTIQTIETVQGNGEAHRNDQSSNSNNPFSCSDLLNAITLRLLALVQSHKQSSHSISSFEYIFIHYLINLFIASTFIFSTCSAQRYYLPAHYDFRMCSTGFRLSVNSVASFNGSSGFTVYFTDNAEIEHYKLNVSFLNRNHLPNFASVKPERISRNQIRSIPNKTTISARRPFELNDYQSIEIFFKEYFYFTKTSDGQMYHVSGYTNELIGCPQVLCLNAYLDAAFHHEKENRIYFFRGAYYYTSRPNDEAFEPSFNLINTKFFGVPFHVDSAAYYQTDFYASEFVILFSKEDTVYVFSDHRGIAIAVPQLKFFHNPVGTPTKRYIDSISDMANGFLMIGKSGSFGLYKIDPKAYETGELSFLIEGHTFPIHSKDNRIENAADSITLRDVDKSRKGDEILFIRRWKVYVYKLDYLNEKINSYLNKKSGEDRVQINEAPFKSELFYDYFGCNYDYMGNLKITKAEFIDTYLKSLPEPHDSSLWSKLVTKQEVYDPNLIYVTIGVVASFLLVAYMLFFIFLMIYFTSRPKENLDDQSLLYETMLANRTREEQDASRSSGQTTKKTDGSERSGQSEKSGKTSKTDKAARVQAEYRQYKQIPKLIRPSTSLKSVDTVVSEEVGMPVRTPSVPKQQIRLARPVSRSPPLKTNASRSPLPFYSSVPAFSDYVDATTSDQDKMMKNEKADSRRLRRY